MEIKEGMRCLSYLVHLSHAMISRKLSGIVKIRKSILRTSFEIQATQNAHIKFLIRCEKSVTRALVLFQTPGEVNVSASAA